MPCLAQIRRPLSYVSRVNQPKKDKLSCFTNTIFTYVIKKYTTYFNPVVGTNLDTQSHAQF